MTREQSRQIRQIEDIVDALSRSVDEDKYLKIYAEL